MSLKNKDLTPPLKLNSKYITCERFIYSKMYFYVSHINAR